MQAILLAGGFGTRLRPLTDTIPKPLVAVAHKSVIERTLRALHRQGFSRVVLTLHYKGEQIERSFGNSYLGMSLSYFYEPSPLGTAGSVRHAATLLEPKPFFVLSGDVLYDLDLVAMAQAQKRKGAVASIALTCVDDPLEYGVVVCNENQQITAFLEKPSRAQAYANTVNTGVYYLNWEILDHIPPNTVYDFSRDLFPALLAQGAMLYGHQDKAVWCDIGSMEDYYRHSFRLATEEGTLQADNIVGKGVQIHPTASVHRSILWDGVQIGPYCRIEGAILANDVHVDAHTVIDEQAALGAGCTVGQGCHIQAGVLIPAHTKIQGGTTQLQHYSFSHNPSQFLFDGGLSGTKSQICPEFVLQLGYSAGKVAKERPVGVFAADTPYCSLLCSAFRCGVIASGARLEFYGIGFASLASFTARRQGALTFCIYESANAQIRISIYDKDGLYPDRQTERALCSAFAAHHECNPAKLGLCEAVEGSTLAYQKAVEALLGDLSGVSIYCNHSAPARIFASACRNAGAICNASPYALRFLFEADGRSVTVLEGGDLPQSLDLWHIVALLIAHKHLDASVPVPLPYSAPAHLVALAKEHGYTVVRYCECPHDQQQAQVRRLAGEQPYLRDAVFACASLLRLMQAKKQPLSSLCKALPDFATTVREIPTPIGSTNRLLCALGQGDGDGVCLHYSDVRQVRILPLGGYALRLICEAESVEAAQELFVNACQEVDRRTKELQKQSEEEPSQ